MSARSVASSASSFAVPVAVIACRFGARAAEPARDARVADELGVASEEVAVAVVGRIHAVEVVDAEAHEPALDGQPALAEVAIGVGRQLGTGLGVGEAGEDLARRLVADLADHLREVAIEVALDPQTTLLLPAIGRHQIDELHDARRVDRHVAVRGAPARAARRARDRAARRAPWRRAAGRRSPATRRWCDRGTPAARPTAGSSRAILAATVAGLRSARGEADRDEHGRADRPARVTHGERYSRFE